MLLARYRLYALNTFIAAIVALVAIDALPVSPLGLRLAIQPLVVKLGINQGPWRLFSPDPDRMNTRLRAEITYRDGERRTWTQPEWSRLSAWQIWVGHRHREWIDYMVSQEAAPSWPPYCRYLARTLRPELPRADQGAEVRLIYRESPVPPADVRPWKRSREPPQFDAGWILTTEKLE